MNQQKGFSKDFWLVVIGQIVSLFGNAILRFALPIHLLNETGSAAIFGIVSGCAFIPLAIMSPIGGIIADRVNKRNIMVCLDFFTSGLTVLVLVLYGKVNLIILILTTLFFLYGISGAYQPSVQASIPVLVEESKIMPGNAIINMVSSLSSLLGPALGGIAYSMWGIYPVLATAAVCFCFSAVMEIFIQIPYTKRKRYLSIVEEAKTDLYESMWYISKEKPEIGKLTLCCAGVNLILSALMIVGLPVLVMQTLGFSGDIASRLYGFMQAILAVGGLAGGVGAGVFSKKWKLEESWKLLMCTGIFLIPMGVILMFQVSAFLSYVILAAAGFLIMACASLYTIQVMSHIQISVPGEIVGKVIAWMIALSTCAQPVGQVIYGFLFQELSQYSFFIFYIAALLSVLIAYGNRKALKR